jgi:hypothetical protein
MRADFWILTVNLRIMYKYIEFWQRPLKRLIEIGHIFSIAFLPKTYLQQTDTCLKSIFFWDMTPCSALSGTRTTRRHIPEEDTLQNHRCENLKSYGYMFVYLYVWVFLYAKI